MRKIKKDKKISAHKKELPLVSVITVNYNGKKFLSDCFGSLYALNYPQDKVEIIMVDNGSTDDSIAYVKKAFPKVLILKDDINNYARANNIGIRHAQGEYVATLNNDTKVDADWLISLARVILQDKTIGAVGSKIVFPDGKVQSAGHVHLPNFYWVDKQEELPENNKHAGSQAVPSVCGCAVLYRKKALADLGYFDEDFNLYMEDVDMALRFKGAHWKIRYAPRSIVFHIKRGTALENQAWFYTERNRLLLLAKHYPDKLSKALFGRGYFTAQRDEQAQNELYKIAVEIVLKLLKHHAPEKIRGILDGLFDELRKFANYDNLILVDKIQHLKQAVHVQEEDLLSKEQGAQALNTQINTLTTELSVFQRRIEEDENRLAQLTLAAKAYQDAVSEKDAAIEQLRGICSKDEQEIMDIKVESQRLMAEIKQYQEAAAEKQSAFNNLRIELAAREQEIEGAAKEMERLTVQEKELQDTARQRQEVIQNLQIELAKREQSLVSTAKEMDRLAIVAKEFQTTAAQRQEVIQKLQIELASKTKEVIEQQQTARERQDMIRNLQAELAKEEQAVNDARQQASQFAVEVQRQQEAVAAEEQIIQDVSRRLASRQQELEAIYNSTAFRWIVRPLWKILWPLKLSLKRWLVCLGLVSKQPLALVPNVLIAPEAPLHTDKPAIAICTIISKNYLAYARVLTDSFLAHNQGQVFVLLVDKVDGYFDPQKEKFTLIELDSLKERIPGFERLAFQYNITEFNTAVKPFFLEFLFEHYHLQKLIFFDPDILITQPLGELNHLLNKYAVILTPHITQPFEDTRKPFEVDILRSGVYNLGFIALSWRDSTRQLLQWWKERLVRYCKIDIQRGLFVDQKWIDLVPGFFDDVFVLRDPRYNVAYWNLHYRRLAMENGKIYVGKHPAYFVHFSGFNPQDASILSKHQDRFTPDTLGRLRKILELYRDKLMVSGYAVSKGWPCVFEYFDNGARIPDVVRDIFWEIAVEGLVFEQPLATGLEGRFLRWLNEPVDGKKPVITNFMYRIYRSRTDAQVCYPDILHAHREDFFQWFLSSPRVEYDFDNRFMGMVFPFNAAMKPQLSAGTQTIAHYLLRNYLKDGIKRITRQNFWVINKLRGLEHRINRWFMYRQKSARQLKYPGKPVYLLASRGESGVNVAGYINAELGVGEGARANIKCLDSAGIKYALINIENHSVARKEDHTFTRFTTVNPYRVNLVHVNADMFARIYAEKGNDFFKDKITIGFWAWELSEFPDEWVESFQYCHEVWVPSSFTQAALARKAPLPITRIPHAIEVSRVKNVDRSFWGWDVKEFVFLFIFDFFSYFERKNPLALMYAFLKAFSPEEKVRLVIKCNNSSFDPSCFERMKEQARGANISIIDKYLYRDEINALVAHCDCYVSLHRSEGFGLTLAEAMYLGKPVIATGYSGNMDFMNTDNSYPVKYKLVPIEKDIGPYKKGCLWAEPDARHAAELMRYVYDHQEHAKDKGQIAAVDIKNNFNFTVVGKLMQERIAAICAGN